MTSRILPADSRTLRAAIALTTSLTVLAFVSAPALADRRAPAPIVFAGQGGNTSAPQARPQKAEKKLSRRERRRAAKLAKRAPAPAAASTRRVEFRYPDQPDTYYGAGGARSESDAAPLSFSSSTSAISQAEAAKYTAGSAPEPVAVAAPAKDPAITSGGFDARAAAARVEQKAALPLVSAAGPADFSSAPLSADPLPVAQNAVAAVETAPRASYQSVSGTALQPKEGALYDKTGHASVFNPVLNGQPTSNGEILDTQAMVAAHPSLPLPSLVQVINLENNREVVVRVNDRGPIDGSGLIEVSERAADVLGFANTGGANVRVRYLGKAPEVGLQAASAPAPVAAPRPVAKPFQVAQSSPFQAASNDEQFLVQLASFSDISNAQRLYTTLGTQLGNIGIVPVRVGGADYFRVVAGPLESRKTAEDLRDRLASQGIARGLVISAS